MADHDLAAELAGYRAELAHAEQFGKDIRAGAVREEIARVEGEVRDMAEAQDRTAGEHEQAGQDVLAAEARVRAREYRELLDDGGKPTARGKRGRGAKENAADKTPTERA